MSKFLRIILSAVVCYCLGTTSLHAQPNTLWTKTFGGSGFERGNSVQQTTDGGYIIGTDNYGLIKTNSKGDILWTNFGIADFSSVRQTSDGGYIAIKTGSDLYFMKIDASGNTVWARTLGGDSVDVGRYGQQTADGGYIITGYTESYGAGMADIWLIKTTSSGGKQWDKTFGGSFVDRGNCVQQTTDGGYIITGYTTYGAGHYDVWLIKTDPSGNTLWTKTFGGTGLDRGYSFQETSDGGYIIAGETSSFGAGYEDVWLIKTTSSGGKQWDKTFGGSEGDHGYSVQQTTDGGYIIAGDTKSYGAGDYVGWLIKTDSLGSKQWDKTFGGSGRSVQQTQDGGYIITGRTGADVWLTKLIGNINVISPDGGEIWLGGSIHDIVRSYYGGDAPDSLKLWYSEDGTSYPNFIEKIASPSDTTYPWSLPYINCNQVRVKVEKFVDIGSADISDANFTIDSDTPSVFTLISPSNGDTTSMLPICIWHSSFDSLTGVTYSLFIDGDVVDSNLADTSYSLSTGRELTEGWHTWYVKAYDGVGHYRQSSQTFSFYAVVFDLLSPADSNWTAETHPLFTWEAVDPEFSHYQLYINDNLDKDSIPPESTSTRSSSYLGSGDYTWYIIAVDDLGEEWQSNQIWLIRVDHTPPVVFGLVSPSDGIWTRDTLPIFEWEASSDAGIGLSKYQLFIDGDSWDDSIPVADTSIVIDSTLTEGPHTWFVRACDVIGNPRNSSSTWTLNIDLSSPEPFSLISPSDSTIVSFPTPSFLWHEATDAGAGLKHYELWINDTLNVGNLSDTISTPASSLGEGCHDWFVKASDSIGNVCNSNQTWTVVLDWNPPGAFSLASPGDYDTVDISLPSLFWHPSVDAGSGISKYELWINGVLNQDSILGSDTSSVPSSPLSIGLYTWFVKAYDKAGEVTSSDDTFYLVMVDTIPPAIPDLIAPTDSAWLNNISVAFEWSAVTKSARNNVLPKWKSMKLLKGSKASSVRYVLQIDTTDSFTNPVIVDTTQSTTDTIDLGENKYWWRVMAFDEAGNEDGFSEPFWFIVDTTFPIIDSTTILQDTVNFWGPFEAKTKITDNAPFNNPVLFYRTSVDTEWVIDTMTSLGGGWFADSIPELPHDSLIVDYYLSVEDLATNKSRNPDTGSYSFVIRHEVGVEDKKVPDKFVLFPPTPNPSLRSVVIKYGLPEKATISLSLYDISGRLVKTICSGTQEKGYHKVDIKDNKLSKGIYFIKFQAGKYEETKKLILMR